MSKQDTHFFNMFSLVLGILIAIAVVIFVLARSVGNSDQAEHLKSESFRVAAVEDRIAPVTRVAVAGQDNSALAIVAPAAAAGATSTAAVPKDGEGVYQAACVACHGAGIAGAPKLSDKAAWSPRIVKGKDTLYKHAIGGFQGANGVMPPKGGRVDLSDDLIRSAVDYMVDHSK